MPEDIEEHPDIYAAEIKNFSGEKFGYSGKMRFLFVRAVNFRQVPEFSNKQILFMFEDPASSLKVTFTAETGGLIVTFEDIKNLEKFSALAEFRETKHLQHINVLREVGLQIGKMFFMNFIDSALSGYSDKGLTLCGTPNMEKVEWSIETNIDYEQPYTSQP